MSGIDDRLRQGITAKPSVRRPTSSYPLRPSERLDVFMELNIIARRDPDSGILVLEPGQRYELTLEISSRPLGEARPAFTLKKGEMQISIRPTGCPELTLLHDDDTQLEEALYVSREEILRGGQIPCWIDVPPECPKRSGSIQVECGLRGTEYSEQPVECALRVDGTHFPWDDQDAKTWHIDPTTKPPDHMALLYAQRQLDSFQLRGRHHLYELQEHDIGILPPLSLASFITNRQRARDIVSRVHHSFSSYETTSPLLSWFKSLLKDYPDTLLLVIVDLSGAEIPWELIPLPQGSYLGVEAEVVRWANLWDFEPIGLRVEESIYEGHAVGFLDDASLAATDRERHELELLGAQRLDSLTSAHDRLSGNLEGISLMYLACHGAVVHPKEEAHRYQALYNSKESLVDLDIEHMKRRSHRIPTIFVNACGSGRFCRDAAGAFGLVSVLLRKVANGYIGTLGDVQEPYAGDLGGEILKTFRTTSDGTRPSECLRQIRRRAAAQHDPERSDDESWQRFLTAFMYVYYGEPFAQIKIRPYRGDQP